MLIKTRCSVGLLLRLRWSVVMVMMGVVYSLVRLLRG